MKTILLRPLLLICLVAITASFNPPVEAIEWMSWEEAITKSKTDKNPKKIFVDVYTDWCGWCKRMDAVTFNNPEVAAYMKSNFYMVKLNAEQKQDIVYNNRTFKYVASGRRGYHELAAQLLKGKLSYPSVVFLDEKVKIVTVVPGFRQPNEFLKVANYVGENIFKNTSWQEYSRSKK
ncbi:thioredoxin family protein [Ascidiimonas sp. W6]|uniref:thioredoxin family protein n=1 Tax=Ascidiimonas meishanensis TaxID=3128903 RepID=UPI0030EEC4E6